MGKIEATKRGRPTKYDEGYVDLAYKYCLLGATNDELAKNFEVTTSTIGKWIAEIPDFSDAVKRGREQADAEIAQSLYHRAKGYSHPDTAVTSYQGDVTLTPIVKHYPPDTAAAFIWLKNRQPQRWRDRQEVEHTVTIDVAERQAVLSDILSIADSNPIEADYTIIEDKDSQE